MSHLKRERAALETSKHYSKLANALSVAKVSCDVRIIVAFGCSSMNWKDYDRHPSYLQHSLIIALRELFLEHGSSNVDCFAHDPIYTEVDKKVLAQVNVSVVDDPRGFLHVDDSSVVISIPPDIPVRQIITDIARPAVLIWDRVRQGLEEDISG